MRGIAESVNPFKIAIAARGQASQRRPHLHDYRPQLDQLRGRWSRPIESRRGDGAGGERPEAISAAGRGQLSQQGTRPRGQLIGEAGQLLQPRHLLGG